MRPPPQETTSFDGDVKWRIRRIPTLFDNDLSENAGKCRKMTSFFTERRKMTENDVFFPEMSENDGKFCIMTLSLVGGASLRKWTQIKVAKWAMSDKSPIAWDHSNLSLLCRNIKVCAFNANIRSQTNWHTWYHDEIIQTLLLSPL